MKEWFDRLMNSEDRAAKMLRVYLVGFVTCAIIVGIYALAVL